MTDPNDWAWFREHQGRTHTARLATAVEIAKLQEHNGLDAASLAPGCFEAFKVNHISEARTVLRIAPTPQERPRRDQLLQECAICLAP
jgi:hypothetical protein